jgi:hypothetical protein
MATSSVPGSALVKFYGTGGNAGVTYLFAQPARKGSSTYTFTLSNLAGAKARVVYDSNAHYDSAHSSVGSVFTLDGSGNFSDTLGANGDDYQVKIYTVQ